MKLFEKDFEKVNMKYFVIKDVKLLRSSFVESEGMEISFLMYIAMACNMQ